MRRNYDCLSGRRAEIGLTSDSAISGPENQFLCSSFDEHRVGLQLYYDHNDPSAASKHLPGVRGHLIRHTCSSHILADTRSAQQSKKKKKHYPPGGVLPQPLTCGLRSCPVSPFLCRVGVLSLRDGCQGRTDREAARSDACLGTTPALACCCRRFRGLLPPLRQLVQILYHLYTR
jgi:hypothetical protein